MSDLVLGFVGLGVMGGPISGRLIDAGYKVVGFDLSDDAVKAAEAKGIEIAGSPKDVGAQADIVLVSLPSPAIVQSVAVEVASGGRARTVIDISTTGPTVAKAVSALLAEQNVSWLDCPVSGGIKGATEGTLAVMVSGPKPVYEEAKGVLDVLGKQFFVGEEAGLAQVAKLANNLLAAAAVVVTSEAMVMATKAGVEPKIMLDIINASSGRNSASQDKFPKSVLPGTFDFGFQTGLSYKDVRMCIDEAEAMGVPMVSGAVVRQILAATNAKFGPTSDFTSIVKITEEWAGVEVRG